MPPFRNDLGTIDRRLRGEALQQLRNSGHEQLFAIVDDSFNVPQGAVEVQYGGTTEQALLGVGAVIPIEGNNVTYMEPDPLIKDLDENSDAFIAAERIKVAAEQLGILIGEEVFVDSRFRKSEDEIIDVNGTELEPVPGFYDVVKNPDEHTIYIRTQDPYKFACVYFRAGHSQDGVPL